MLNRNLDKMWVKVECIRYYHDDHHVKYGLLWMLIRRDDDNSIKVRGEWAGPHPVSDWQSINVSTDTGATDS